MPKSFLLLFFFHTEVPGVAQIRVKKIQILFPSFLRAEIQPLPHKTGMAVCTHVHERATHHRTFYATSAQLRTQYTFSLSLTPSREMIKDVQCVSLCYANS